MRYLYIFGTLFFTVYGQLILKWRLGKLGFVLPEGGLWDKLLSLLKIIFDPFIFSGFASYKPFVPSIDFK
jgi:undecaprenyl phosphate-alpha-L-ara4N flippase subunit ArnF